VEPLDDHPSEGTGRGAKMGNQRCHASLGTSTQGRASIETERANPEKGGADEGQQAIQIGFLCLFARWFE